MFKLCQHISACAYTIRIHNTYTIPTQGQGRGQGQTRDRCQGRGQGQTRYRCQGQTRD